MGNIKITAAKLVTPTGKDKSGWWLEVSMTDTVNGKEHQDDKLGKNNPHPDLVAAFGKLGKHIASLTLQHNAKGELDVESIEARGYSLKGEEEKEGITITGQRKVELNKSITLNTPFLNWQRTDDYPAMDELSKLIDLCNEEVMAYLFEDKFFIENQMSLALDETPQVDARTKELLDLGFVKKGEAFHYEDMKIEVVEVESYSDKDWKSYIKKLSKKVAA